MLFECLEVENDGNWFFHGFNNTPFDEAVYTSNHLLRAPGASKAITDDSPALALWYDGTSCLVASRRFSDCFSGDDPGLITWRDHLIGAPMTGSIHTVTCGIAGWKPSLSYPTPHHWYADCRGPSRAVNIDHVVDRMMRNYTDLPRYTEARRTKIAHR